MALQTSGAISLANIQSEFGGSNPIGLNEYYGAASGIPSSGAIDFADFYGKSSGPTANGGGRYIAAPGQVATSLININITTDNIYFAVLPDQPSTPLNGTSPAEWYVASTNGSYVYRCIGWQGTAVDKIRINNLVFERLSGAPLPTGASGYYDVDDYSPTFRTGRYFCPPSLIESSSSHPNKYFALSRVGLESSALTNNPTVPFACEDFLSYNSTLTFNT